MNIKKAMNSQLLTIESKTNKQTNQKNRTGIESQVWRSFGELLIGRGERRMREKVQGLKSIIGRYKIDRGMLRIVQEMEKPKNLYA